MPLAIDELPLVALLGCFAEGETVVRGAAGAAPEGVRPHRRRGRGPARPRRRHRGHRGRLRRARRRRPARRHDRRPRRPPHGDDGRRRRARLARGSRGASGSTPPRSPTRPSSPTCTRSRERRRRLLVAIDGPAGAGKSTVARELARELGFSYLDSGAMYRSVGAAGAAQPRRRAGAAGRASCASSCARASPGESRVLLDGRDVSAAIRTPAVAAEASRVAADPAVRAALRGEAARAARARRLGRRGTRHRHRRRPPRRAEGVPDRRPARAGPQAGARARRGPGRGHGGADGPRRARPRPRDTLP